jgi:hypothetical protein
MCRRWYDCNGVEGGQEVCGVAVWLAGRNTNFVGACLLDDSAVRTLLQVDIAKGCTLQVHRRETAGTGSEVVLPVTFRAQWLTLYTARFNINSTFCPHSVFMCFVWISEQTAITSLYNINWLVCITETECVYCAVRNVFIYNVYQPFKSQWLLYVPPV